MYNNKLIQISLFSLLFICAIVFAVWPAVTEAAAVLKLEIILDKQEYKIPPDEIKISFSLENQGKEAVWVNKRFYFSSDKVAKDIREVYVEVSGPSGNKLDCLYAYPTGLPKSDDFYLLQPREMVSSEKRTLNYFFKLEEPGTYKLRAYYENVYGREIGLDVFGGRLVSEPVTFKLVK